MASLAEREGLRGKVQCIYLDPPYGIKFNSNFQWSTTSRDVKDGKREHITREPEQVKAFRDTWRDGIHSYLTYLRDRLTVARDLLTESGSIFVQIGDENVHRVRALMDEVFGDENFTREIFFAKTGSLTSSFVGRTGDRILWYAKDKASCKFRPLFKEKDKDNFYKQVEYEPFSYRTIEGQEKHMRPSEIQGRIFRFVSLESPGTARGDTPLKYEGTTYRPNKNQHWTLSYPQGMVRLELSGRIAAQGRKLSYRLYIDDYPVKRLNDVWGDTSGFSANQTYVVETRPKIVERCILMTTDPGDLVLDPTCGSGTTAYVAEQWGRRWITIDTSRVALALARARIMGARYPYYLLADSVEGRRKEAEITQTLPLDSPPPPPPPKNYKNIRDGFVYERVPHITLKSIANNAEIDVLYEQHQPVVDTALADLNTALESHATPFTVLTGGRKGEKIDFTASGAVTMPSGEAAPANGFMEWEVPREACHDWPEAAAEPLERFWQARIARQRAIDASIAAKAEFEYLYDKPYEDKQAVASGWPLHGGEPVAPPRTRRG